MWRRRIRTGTPSTSTERSSRASSPAKLHVLLQPGAEPGLEQSGIGARAADVENLRLEGPEVGETRPERKPARPGKVGDGDAVKELRQAAVGGCRPVAPLARVDDQPVVDTRPAARGRATRTEAGPASAGTPAGRRSAAVRPRSPAPSPSRRAARSARSRRTSRARRSGSIRARPVRPASSRRRRGRDEARSSGTARARPSPRARGRRRAPTRAAPRRYA